MVLGNALFRDYFYNNYSSFQSYKRNLLKSAYKDLGRLEIAAGKRDTFDAVQHQVLIAKVACVSQLPECMDDATKLFNEWMDAPEKPNP